MNTQPLLAAVLVFIIISVILLIPLYLRSRVLAAMPSQPQPSFRKQVACLPLIIGMAVMCTLAGCIVPLGLISDDQITRTEGKPVIQALTPDLAGQEVVAEGIISEENPIQAGGLVAYVRTTESTRGNETGILGLAMPPLRVRLASGEAWVEDPASPADADYTLENAWIRTGEKRVTTRGLARGQQVLVFGTVAAGPGGAYLNARTIFAGSRAEYLNGIRSSRMPTPVMIGMAVLGLGICAYALFPALGRRKARQW